MNKYLKYKPILVQQLKKLIPMKFRSVFVNHINKDESIRIYLNNNQINLYKEKATGLVPVFYWDSRPNFGDLVGPYLISKITKKPVLNIMGTSRPGLMTVGSIIQMLNNKNMTIWGSGLMSEPNKDTIKRLSFYKPNILSVRGYKTAEALKNIGLEVPDYNQYGDPALVLPLFYQPKIVSDKKIGICPHYSHKELFNQIHHDKNLFNMIDVQKDLEAVLDSIFASKVCISTSLHGLIVAQAYGIPWVWLEITDNHLSGRDFKFQDFFSTIDASQVAHVQTTKDNVKNLDFQSIAKEARLPDSRYDQSKILKSLQQYLLKELPEFTIS